MCNLQGCLNVQVYVQHIHALLLNARQSSLKVVVFFIVVEVVVVPRQAEKYLLRSELQDSIQSYLRHVHKTLLNVRK